MKGLVITPTIENMHYLATNASKYTVRLKLVNGNYLHGESIRLLSNGYIGIYVKSIPYLQNGGEYTYKLDELTEVLIRFV